MTIPEPPAGGPEGPGRHWGAGAGAGGGGMRARWAASGPLLAPCCCWGCLLPVFARPACVLGGGWRCLLFSASGSAGGPAAAAGFEGRTTSSSFCEAVMVMVSQQAARSLFSCFRLTGIPSKRKV